MNFIKCPNCGCENKNTNIKCESCGTILNDSTLIKSASIEQVQKVNPKFQKVTFIILIVLLFPLAFFGVLNIYVGVDNLIIQNITARNYIESESKLVDYGDCTVYDDGDELCSGIYEYIVNDVTYKVSPSSRYSKEQLEQKIIIKYNPSNPSEYIVKNNSLVSLVIGIIFLSIFFKIIVGNKLPNTKKDNI